MRLLVVLCTGLSLDSIGETSGDDVAILAKPDTGDGVVSTRI